MVAAFDARGTSPTHADPGGARRSARARRATRNADHAWAGQVTATGMLRDRQPAGSGLRLDALHRHRAGPAAPPPAQTERCGRRCRSRGSTLAGMPHEPANAVVALETATDRDATASYGRLELGPGSGCARSTLDRRSREDRAALASAKWLTLMTAIARPGLDHQRSHRPCERRGGRWTCRCLVLPRAPTRLDST